MNEPVFDRSNFKPIPDAWPGLISRAPMQGPMTAPSREQTLIERLKKVIGQLHDTQSEIIRIVGKLEAREMRVDAERLLGAAENLEKQTQR